MDVEECMPFTYNLVEPAEMMFVIRHRMERVVQKGDKVPDTSYHDSLVVVTGGSAGLGLAIARAFLRQRARVVLVARDADRLAIAASSLRAEVAVGTPSCQVHTVVADVTDDHQVVQAMDTVRQQFGGLDVLVNAAGISDRSKVLETEPQRFQRLWDLNFLGVVRCVRAAAPDLVSRGGQIINIGSLASKVASGYLGAYPASKFALAAYSQQLRIELEPLGVHVLLVCPGPIRRDDAGRRYDDQAADLPAAARQPGGGARLKALDPDQLANRILLARRRREVELVVPPKVKWLAAFAQLFPRWADQIVRRSTGGH